MVATPSAKSATSRPSARPRRLRSFSTASSLCPLKVAQDETSEVNTRWFSLRVTREGNIFTPADWSNWMPHSARLATNYAPNIWSPTTPALDSPIRTFAASISRSIPLPRITPIPPSCRSATGLVTTPCRGSKRRATSSSKLSERPELLDLYLKHQLRPAIQAHILAGGDKHRILAQFKIVEPDHALRLSIQYRPALLRTGGRTGHRRSRGAGGHTRIVAGQPGHHTGAALLCACIRILGHCLYLAFNGYIFSGWQTDLVEDNSQRRLRVAPGAGLRLRHMAGYLAAARNLCSVLQAQIGCDLARHRVTFLQLFRVKRLG